MKNEQELVLAIGAMRAAAKIVSDDTDNSRNPAEEFCYAALHALEWVYDGRDPRGVLENLLNLGLSKLYEQYEKTGDDPQAMVPLMTPAKNGPNDG